MHSAMAERETAKPSTWARATEMAVEAMVRETMAAAQMEVVAEPTGSGWTTYSNRVVTRSDGRSARIPPKGKSH